MSSACKMFHVESSINFHTIRREIYSRVVAVGKEQSLTSFILRGIVVCNPLVALEGVRHVLLWIADNGPTTLTEVLADLVETENTSCIRVGSGSSSVYGWRAKPVVTRICQGEGFTIGGNA